MKPSANQYRILGDQLRESPAIHINLVKLILPQLIIGSTLFGFSPCAHGQTDYDDEIPGKSHRNLGESNETDISLLQKKLLKNFQSMDPKERDNFLKAFQGRDPESMKDPESFDPKQRDALQKMMKNLMEKRGQENPDQERDPRPTSGGDPNESKMPPEIRKMLEGLQKPKTDQSASPLEELMDDPDLQSFVRDLTDGLNSKNRDGEAAFPWLSDPRFPQDLLKLRQEKGFFNDFTKKITRSSKINSLLKKGLKWRRENSESSRSSGRSNSQRSTNGSTRGSTTTPDSQGSQSPTVLQRLSNLSPSQASSNTGMGWNIPKLPLFFSFSGPGMGQRTMPSFDVSRPRAPSFDPTIFFFVLLGLFLFAVIGLVFGARLQNRVSHWIEKGQGRLRPRRGWPTPPEQMTSNQDFVANVLHLNSKLYPHRLWNHNQLRSELRNANPQSQAEIERLSRDFERAYYRQSESALQRGKLHEHARVLRKLGSDQAPTG